MTFADAARELYGLDPAEFTSARDARAAEARAGGDPELAAMIKGLTRPSLSAWAVNQLARRRPEQVGRLVELGAGLREAQSNLSGDDLRKLTRQRHQVVRALAQEVRSLARDLGHPVSDAVGREVEATLEAALADEEAAREVQNGTLSRALQHTGLGPGEVTAAGRQPPSSDVPGAADDDGAEAEQRAREADAAEAELARAERRREEAERRRTDAEAAVRAVEADLSAARDAARDAAGAARDAARAADSARRAAQAARRRSQPPG